MLKWTKVFPTESGWYWFRDLGRSKQDDVIVRVMKTEIGRMIFMDGRLPNSVSAWEGLWAGPILAPEE